jgi:hypothetical protein
MYPEKFTEQYILSLGDLAEVVSLLQKLFRLKAKQQSLMSKIVTKVKK